VGRLENLPPGSGANGAKARDLPLPGRKDPETVSSIPPLTTVVLEGTQQLLGQGFRSRGG